MQMNEMELWALFGLLEPEGWNEFEYRMFYQDAVPDIPELEIQERPMEEIQSHCESVRSAEQREQRLPRIHAPRSCCNQTDP